MLGCISHRLPVECCGHVEQGRGIECGTFKCQEHVVALSII